jgi:hypothetical protein
MPLKIAAGLLAVLCLPAVLGIMPGAGDAGTAGEAMAVRPLLWLPACGLVASVLVPPGGDDAGGVLRFLAVTLAAAAVAIGLAVAAARAGDAMRRMYGRGLALVAAAVLVIAAVTSDLS